MDSVPCDPKKYLEKKHICHICDYRTISNWSLKRHLKSCRKKYEKIYSKIYSSSSPSQVPPNTNTNIASSSTLTPSPSPPIASSSTSPSFPKPSAPTLTNLPSNSSSSFTIPPPPPPTSISHSPVTYLPSSPSPSPSKSVFVGKTTTDTNLNISIDCRLIKNFKIYISGPSRCGKSVFLVNFLKNMKVFMKEPPELICFVYAEYQSDIYDQMKNEIVDYFIQDDEQLQSNIERIVEINKQKPTLIIYDDLINSKNLSFIAKQFTVNGRHNGISQVFVSQKLFPKDDNIRLISNNSDYLVIFKNPRNATEIKILSNQMSRNVLSEIFKKATIDPYSYLLIDLTQECIPEKRYLSHLFNSDNYIYTYIEN